MQRAAQRRRTIVLVLGGHGRGQLRSNLRQRFLLVREELLLELQLCAPLLPSFREYRETLNVRENALQLQ